MTTEERLQEDMKLALKAGKKDELSAIRLMRAQLKDAKIEIGEELTEQQVTGVLQKAAKKRKESIEMYLDGNRQDLADKEAFELSIIKRYLPEEMSEDAILDIIRNEITSLNLNSDKDIGRLMGVIMPKLKGKADGNLVQQLARKALADLSS
jgi:uncharacterized protein YqeY